MSSANSNNVELHFYNKKFSSMQTPQINIKGFPLCVDAKKVVFKLQSLAGEDSTHRT